MADFLATNDFAGTGAVMQVEINFAGVRLDLPDQPNPYLEDDDVKGVIITPATSLTVETSVPVTMVKINDNTFTTAPTTVGIGKVLRVYRDTDIEFPIVDFVSLQVVSESDLDNQARQTLYAVMESRDNSAIAVDQANAASATAVAANITANEALEVAESAVATANSADSKADQAIATANAADLKSDQALAAAASAEAHADSADIAAQAAQDAAAAAEAASDIAVADAAEALSVANSIDAKAQSALDTSASAANTANIAISVANAIAAKAQQALDTSESAQTDASTALSTANAIDAKAQEALDDAEAAQAAAASAVSTANDANANANGRQPGDATLTALAALVISANKMIYGTGTDAFALADLTAFARTLLDDATDVAARATLGVRDLDTSYISGLRMTWQGARAMSVETGKCLLSGGTEVVVNSTIVKTDITLVSSGFTHVYLYLNAGVPDIEFSSAVPVNYRGTAYNKTGDASRRYMGSLLANSSSNMYKWRHDLQRNCITYLEAASVGPPFALVVGYGSATPGVVSCQGVCPAHTTTHMLVNTNSTGLGYYFLPDQQQAMTAGTFMQVVGSQGGTLPQLDSHVVEVSRAGATNGIFYVATSGTASTQINTWVYGYIYER